MCIVFTFPKTNEYSFGFEGQRPVEPVHNRTSWRTPAAAKQQMIASAAAAAARVAFNVRIFDDFFTCLNRTLEG